jgi:hypothetical protein
MLRQKHFSDVQRKRGQKQDNEQFLRVFPKPDQVFRETVSHIHCSITLFYHRTSIDEQGFWKYYKKAYGLLAYARGGQASGGSK